VDSNLDKFSKAVDDVTTDYKYPSDNKSFEEKMTSLVNPI